MFVIKDEPVLCFIPGDRELNEVKLLNHFKVGEHEMEMASDEVIRDAMGAEPGFTGPVGIKKEVRIIVDKRVTEMKNLVVGANKVDYHLKNVNYGRDFTGEVVEDLLLVEKGDKCPKCGAELFMDRGIEVGNIFQLGTKYSDGLKAGYLDENGKELPFYMGSYGIGVSRSVAAVIEQNNDERGIVWPLVVAPYQVIITVVNMKAEEQVELGEKLYKDFKSLGLEVLLDDRNERAGVKFNDRDLIGIPVRITVGKRAGEEVVEYSLRTSEDKEEVNISELENLIREEFTKAGLKF